MSIFKSAEHLARRTDPESSHLAAKRMVESGALGIQHQAAYDLVLRYPGCTSDELARHGQLDRYQLARRLPELERAGLVEKGPLRQSTITKRPGVVWYANPGAIQCRT